MKTTVFKVYPDGFDNHAFLISPKRKKKREFIEFLSDKGWSYRAISVRSSTARELLEEGPEYGVYRRQKHDLDTQEQEEKAIELLKDFVSENPEVEFDDFDVIMS